jgi:hypothetical protein
MLFGNQALLIYNKVKFEKEKKKKLPKFVMFSLPSKIIIGIYCSGMVILSRAV